MREHPFVMSKTRNLFIVKSFDVVNIKYIREISIVLWNNTLYYIIFKTICIISYIYIYIFFSSSFSFPLRKNIVLTINNIDTRPPQLHLQQLLTETNEQQREEDEPSEFPGKSIYSYYYTKETCFDTEWGGGCDYDIQLSIKTKTLPPCSLNLANSQLNKYAKDLVSRFE